MLAIQLESGIIEDNINMNTDGFLYQQWNDDYIEIYTN
jgi:hypothetical protein